MSRRLRWLIGGGVLGVVIVGVAVWFVFFRDDAPSEVDLETANLQLDEDLAASGGDTATDDDTGGDDPAGDTATGGDTAGGDTAGDTPGSDGGGGDDETPTAAPPSFDGDIDGTWVIDDEIGSFTFDTASGSFAGFRVAEELTIGESTAVGRTGDVTGSLTIEGGTLIAAEVTVDMTTIVSNESRRENAIRRAVGAADFPNATFVLTEPVELPEGLAAGDAVSIDAVGDLTVKGTTNEVTFAIDAAVRDDGFGVITGSTSIIWDDFGVTPPSAPIVVSVADQGTVEFQLIVRRST